MKHIFRKLIEIYKVDDASKQVTQYCVVPLRNHCWCDHDMCRETKELIDIDVDGAKIEDGTYQVIQFTFYSSEYSHKRNMHSIICGLKDSCVINDTSFVDAFYYFIDQFKVDLGILGISKRELINYINKYEASDIWYRKIQ